MAVEPREKVASLGIAPSRSIRCRVVGRFHTALAAQGRRTCQVVTEDGMMVQILMARHDPEHPPAHPVHHPVAPPAPLTRIPQPPCHRRRQTQPAICLAQRGYRSSARRQRSHPRFQAACSQPGCASKGAYKEWLTEYRFIGFGSYINRDSRV